MAHPPIHIHEVLATLSQGDDRAFLIEFVRAADGSGGSKGSIKRAHVYFGAPNPRDRQRPPSAVNPPPSAVNRKKHFDSNTIPLTEAGSRRMLTPFITHLIKFDGRKIYH